MRHDNATEPMTLEKAIKLKAFEYMMRMKNAGVPWAHCNMAALVMALNEKERFFKTFTGTEQEKQKRLHQFELLEQGIKGYLPMPKDPPTPVALSIYGQPFTICINNEIPDGHFIINKNGFEKLNNPLL